MKNLTYIKAHKMKFCKICVKNCEQVKKINESEITSGGNIVKINYLLNIFQNDIVKFLLDDIDTLICSICLEQLRKCFEFVQKIKESEYILSRGKEIKTDHDYYEAKNKDVNETTNVKITVDNSIKKSAKNEAVNSKSVFVPILPKTSSKCANKKVNKASDTTTRLYRCLKCTDFFKSYKHLTEHEKEFCKNKLVKYFKVCKFCHKCFNKDDSLSDHLSVKHVKEQFLCCLCEDKSFTAKGYLCRHILKAHHHESLKYFCGLCTDMLSFQSPDDLREHFLQSHPLENASIEDQNKNDLNEDDMDLEMHEEFLDEFLLAHTNENSFQFSECWEALDLHLSDMLQESAVNNNAQDFTQAFSCPKCFEQFKSPQPLLKHLADIHDLPVLICRVCNKCFASFKEFKMHKLQKCLKNSTLHSITLDCPYCSKQFKNSSNLKQHLRGVHCQLKKHICQLCDKQFSTLDHLKKHVLSQHQNERKHLCTVCDKKFTQLGHLKQHLAIHTTGKTIQCPECTSKFWRKIDLERHRTKNHIFGGADK